MWRFAALIVALLLPGLARAEVADAAFRSGLAAFNDGSYARALEAWGPLADTGDARAKTGLGFMYYSGRGVPHDSMRAAEYDLPVVWIVANDGGFGMVDQGESLLMGQRISPSRYRRPIDAAGVAEALGTRAFRADSPDRFEEAVGDAVASRRPCVVDVRIDASETPTTLRMGADSLRQMFDA